MTLQWSKSHRSIGQSIRYSKEKFKKTLLLFSGKNDSKQLILIANCFKFLKKKKNTPFKKNWINNFQDLWILKSSMWNLMGCLFLLKQAQPVSPHLCKLCWEQSKTVSEWKTVFLWRLFLQLGNDIFDKR